MNDFRSLRNTSKSVKEISQILFFVVRTEISFCHRWSACVAKTSDLTAVCRKEFLYGTIWIPKWLNCNEMYVFTIFIYLIHSVTYCHRRRLLGVVCINAKRRRARDESKIVQKKKWCEAFIDIIKYCCHCQKCPNFISSFNNVAVDHPPKLAPITKTPTKKRERIWWWEEKKNFIFCLIKFYLPADRWKQERKLLNSSFSRPILQSYIPIFNKCIANSTEHLKEMCDKGEFDIKHDVTVVVMNAVMSKGKI